MLQLADVNAAQPGMASHVRLRPAALFSQVPDSLAEANADVGCHATDMEISFGLNLATRLSSLLRAERLPDARFQPVVA